MRYQWDFHAASMSTHAFRKGKVAIDCLKSALLAEGTFPYYLLDN